jgi:hypothetical protein
MKKFVVFVQTTTWAPQKDQLAHRLPQFWFDDLTDGAVRLLTEREIEEDARVKLERAMQPVHLTLPPIKTKQDDDSLLPGMGSKAPATGQAEEQMALQAAVLQEWHILRAQQVH